MRYVIKRKDFKLNGIDFSMFGTDRNLMKVLFSKVNVEGIGRLIGYRCKRIIIISGSRKFVMFARKLFMTSNEYFDASVFERINGDGIIFVNFKER